MGIGILQSPEVTAAEGAGRWEMESLRESAGWNPENFAREQIRGLVRQVFLSNGARPVRQVVFSSVEPETDMPGLCRWVGEALATQTPGTVAVVGAYPRLLQAGEKKPAESAERGAKDHGMPLRQIAARVRANLWLVPNGERGGGSITSVGLHSYLGEVRREFEYSVIQGPDAGKSDAATAVAQFADGIILVLSAQRTKRAAARKIKEWLEAAQVRILGAVLSDRVFPIPDAIYRRL